MSSTILLADGSGFQFALQQSSLPGLIICILLLIMSSCSWAVMITKIRQVRKARRTSEIFLSQYRGSPTPLQILGNPESHDSGQSPFFMSYLAASEEIAFQLLGSKEVDETFNARLRTAGKISHPQMQGVTTAMERSVGESVLKFESQMTLLATAVSGAPFLGLLGTVWGVMDTFGSIAGSDGVASLKTMAPGVSAALVTTVVALLVAIPAMFGYNYLVNSIRSLVVHLDNFAAELSGDLERTWVDHGKKFDPLYPAPESQMLRPD